MTPTPDEQHEPQFVPESDVIGRVATPTRVVVACAPIVLMTITPLLPFATTPTMWFGVPAVLVWIAVLVVLTVAILQLLDRSINRQAAEASRKGDRP